MYVHVWCRKMRSKHFFFILTDMFRRYIRHRQCDGYESLQLIKRACYNVQYKTKLIDARSRIYRESVR